MSTLGIIGSGNIGSAIARLAVAAGIDVIIANSRGPETLADLVAELGPRATAGMASEVAALSDHVVVSIPLQNYLQLPAEPLAGKLVLDTINYYPYRDGRIAELDSEQTTTSELVQAHLVDAQVVKAFNNILAHHIPVLARPAGADDRSALPIAGDDARAKEIAASLIDRLGFDTVDAGKLAQGWRFEPETPAYTPAYAADPASLAENFQTDPGIALSADSLRALLADAHRPPVADREF